MKSYSKLKIRQIKWGDEDYHDDGCVNLWSDTTYPTINIRNFNRKRGVLKITLGYRLRYENVEESFNSIEEAKNRGQEIFEQMIMKEYVE